jgi:hypothetical protein
MLDETFAASPACFLNARRQKLTDVFAAWNVVTHGHKLRSRSCFVLTLSPIRSQGEGKMVCMDYTQYPSTMPTNRVYKVCGTCPVTKLEESDNGLRRQAQNEE